MTAGLAVLALLGAWSLGVAGCTQGQGYTRVDGPPDSFFASMRLSGGEISRLEHNAHYYTLMGKPELGLMEMEQAHQEYPDNLQIVNLLAAHYEDLGKFQAARQLYQEALNRNGYNPVLTNNLCFSYYREGRYQEAEDGFRQALSQDPGNKMFRNNLGLIYCRLGRQDEARRLWEETSNVTLADCMVQQALAALGLPHRPILAQGHAPVTTMARNTQASAAGSHAPITDTVLTAARPVATQVAAKPVAPTPAKAQPEARRAAAAPQPAPPPARVAPASPAQIAAAAAPNPAQPLAPQKPAVQVAAPPMAPTPAPATPQPKAAPPAAVPAPAPAPVKVAAAPAAPAPVPAPQAASQPRPAPLTVAELVGTPIELRNGTRYKNLARETRSLLQGQGFTVGFIGNHIDFGATKSMIYYRPGAERVARALAQTVFPGAALAPGRKLKKGMDVKVLLGQDLLDNPQFVARLNQDAPAAAPVASTSPAAAKLRAAKVAAPAPPAVHPEPLKVVPAKVGPVVPKPMPPASQGMAAASPASSGMGLPPYLTCEELVDTAIEVRNGTWTKNLAHETRSLLQEQGFTVALIGNHIDFGATTTTIYYRPEAERVARAVAETVFPGAVLAPSEKLKRGMDVKILLGADLLQRPQVMARLVAEGK